MIDVITSQLADICQDISCQARVCVSIGESTIEAAVASAQKAAEKADIVEIRLDFLDQPVVAPFIAKHACPLLFTNRPIWEGGKCTAPESERIELLIEAISLKAAWVDMEFKAGKAVWMEALQAKKHSPTQLILSFHDFEGTPKDSILLDILRQMKDSGADAGKIITTATSHEDVLRTLNLLAEARSLAFPLATFCMGKIGKISRLASVVLGGYLTYCAPDNNPGTAPGQLTVSEMRTLLQQFT